MNIQDVFNLAAADYDQLRRTLIPCFDEFYQMAIDVIPGDRQALLRVLDLGAGTGLYSAMVQAVFPNAQLTLLDFATDMLQQAKSRFARMGKSLTLMVGDYNDVDLGGPYDLIISALSIHHLSDLDKQRLYQRVYQALQPGGLFINADQILGKTPELQQFYQQRWFDTVRERGIADEQLQAALHRMTYDRLAPLDQQLQWLEAVGFQTVDCWYKHLNFAVFGGKRPDRDGNVLQQQPTLYTDRLVLRPFSLGDAPTVQQLAGDRDIAARTLSIPHPYEDGMAETWITSHPVAFAQRQAVTFAIVLRTTGELCGAIGLGIEADGNTAEMGYWIGKPYWGNGYCTEAAMAVVQYGFEVLNLHRIQSTHFSTNPASGRVMQTIGMKHEGRRRQHTLKWDTYEDIELYGILKSDWQA